MDQLVRDVAAAYLSTVDREAPALIEALYLVGSVTLDDFHPGASDIDFIAVTSRPLSDSDISALTRTHAALAARYRRPFFDGTYVTWPDLARDPALAGPGAHAHEHRLHRRADDGCDQVTWHSLARYGLTLRGPRREDIAVHADPAALATWTRRNLDDYWRPWLRRSSRLLSRPGLACVHPWGPAWGVLGVSRLHYTLATGDITSKRGAGEYARDTFSPRWHRILNECLRIRLATPGPSLYPNPLTRRREALTFVSMAIEATHALPPRHDT